VIFAHSSGENRGNHRDGILSDALATRGLATLRFDMLTAHEEHDRASPRVRFDHSFLAGRIVDAVDWVRSRSRSRDWPIGLMGSSTGAAAAFIAAVRRPQAVSAIVARGGRTDLAAQILGQVTAPTLLVVGDEDAVTLEHNKRGRDQLVAAVRRLEVVPGAGHRFDEPGALESVATLSSAWFIEHLAPHSRSATGEILEPSLVSRFRPRLEDDPHE
jgi:pimeloyl-ACP methyl ester carboxylesterase